MSSGVNFRGHILIWVLLTAILILFFFIAFINPLVENLGISQDSKIIYYTTSGGFFITVVGWFINSYWTRKSQEKQALKERKLQQKQLAIQILHENRFEEQWVIARRKVYTIFRNEPNFDWGKLLTRYLDKSDRLNEDEDEKLQALFEVANYFEFASIAINNQAIDPYIFKLSYKGHFERVLKFSNNFFEVCKKNQPSAYCNYLDVCEKWFSSDFDKNIARPEKES